MDQPHFYQTILNSWSYLDLKIINLAVYDDAWLDMHIGMIKCGAQVKISTTHPDVLEHKWHWTKWRYIGDTQGVYHAVTWHMCDITEKVMCVSNCSFEEILQGSFLGVRKVKKSNETHGLHIWVYKRRRRSTYSLNDI